jgi:glycine cleavage system protein P-like pyridoxal-binding family
MGLIISENFLFCYPTLLLWLFALTLISATYFFLPVHLKFKFSKISGIGIVANCFVFGLFMYRNNLPHITQNWYGHFLKPQALLEVRIASSPEQKAKTIRYVAHVSAIVDGQQKHLVNGKILVYFPRSEKACNFRYGDTLVVLNKLQPVPSPKNPGEFDYQRYLQRQQIYHQLFLGNTTYMVMRNQSKSIYSYILSLKDATGDEIPTKFLRTSKYLTHPVFNTNHSETGMMRYLRNLADKDLALDRTMIPLGSCTMKLNSVTEMEAVTWPEFASLHPFAPTDQSVGTRKLIDQLSKWLVAITGYDAVSLQPNAGSQGEFAGLLAIRNYHDSRGDQSRNICLIPSSAHGTNAASAVMAGMKVVVIDCDESGNVSVADIKAKIAEHKDALAALMITYPSTHGVFETAVSEICELIHEAGGQVYVDGANLNALVGVSQPGKFGADVSHLNLHKTFAIPHGGGGPGVGPVIARAHLAPFLPNHPLDKLAGPSTGPGPISGAPYGSASILPISWAYIRLLGGEGLTHATQVAILSANYMAARLSDSYPILYTGANGRVAH